MRRGYNTPCLQLIALLFLLLSIASCKKDNKSDAAIAPPVPVPTTLGVYESDSSIFKLLFMSVSKIGTQTVNYDLVFDTGSGGMVIDANGILQASMITSTGFNFTGDSTVVNGITITNEQAIVEYGNDAASLTKVYGNLAYASVTIGETNGNIVIQRLPFFLYYKGVDAKGNNLPAHYFDVLGVSPGYDVTFSNNAYITSPFSNYTPATGLTKGMKIAALGTSRFSINGTYVPGVVTLGLTDADLSTAGFTMNQLTFNAADGYYPYVKGTATYNGKSVATSYIFDTGTEPYSYIEDKAAGALALLPANSPVTFTTTTGFNYAYTTTPTENLTYIENPTTTGASLSILSLEFFLNNEYLLDFVNHKVGVKVN